MVLVTAIRDRDHDHLDLVKLMLPHEPTRILAIRSGFGSEAWGHCGHFKRQAGDVQNLASEEVRERYLTRHSVVRR